jgi:CubicO group peptidase (beta-lactamase class C family)
MDAMMKPAPMAQRSADLIIPVSPLEAFARMIGHRQRLVMVQYHTTLDASGYCGIVRHSSKDNQTMRADSIIDTAFEPASTALGEGRIPGAAMGIVTRDGDRAVRVEGAAQIEPEREAMGRETWFDLASLTKVIFTTSAILRYVEQGRIALDDPLTKAIPDLRQYDQNAAERRLTFRQCLAHRTHLPAVEPLYTYGQTPQTLQAFVLQREWRAGPPVYSDNNFILLGIAIERLSGLPLAGQPLLPGFTFRPDPAACAATERCAWRGRVIRGEVHDENAFALGGASGHAGLFGTIDGVLDFAQGLLDGSLMSRASLDAIRERQSATRTIGWEAFHKGWSGGDLCSTSAIGHTGFTGTGLWLDFERGLAWALLTNRVHPTRHSESGIVALRRAAGERVMQGFDRTA